MASGLDLTFEVLAQSKNDASVPWLIAAFSDPHSELRTRGLRGLLARRNPAGFREIVRQWPTLDDAQQHIVEENAGRMSGAIREGILSNDPELNRHSCEIVVRLRDYDLMPTLVRAAEDKANPFAEQTAQAAVLLTAHLADELNSPRDYRTRRDPALVRQFVYNALEHSVRHFADHRRAGLLEAFLLLVKKGDSLLRQVLENPDDAAYASVVRHLSTSTRPGVLRVISDLMDELHAPQAILHLVSRRHDEPFLRMFLSGVTKKHSSSLRCNLRKIESWSWLREDLSVLRTLQDEELCGAVHVATSSGMNRLRAFEVIHFALQHGGVLSRRAAAALLVEFKGSDANELVISALKDNDPEVQAYAIKQLRERAIPGAIQRLIEMLESPHEVVCNAVHEALAEFTFQRFLGAFEMLDKDARRVTGALVKRVDRDAIGQLQVELTSLSRSRRLRGLEVAVAMQAIREVEEEILSLSCDTDHFVRVASVPALALINSPACRQRLQELRYDRAASVQEAVEQAFTQRVVIPDPFANGFGDSAVGTPTA